MGTSLMLAAIMGHLDISQALLDAGANVDKADNKGNTALHIASYYCTRPKMTELLIKAGATVDASSANGATPLILAASSDKKRCAEVLLRHGADIAAVNEQGANALTRAQQKGST